MTEVLISTDVWWLVLTTPGMNEETVRVRIPVEQDDFDDSEEEEDPEDESVVFQVEVCFRTIVGGEIPHI